MLAILTFLSGQSYAATSASAPTSATVIAAISITKTGDLLFGTAVQGDVSKTVLPADATAAVFNVSGQPSTAYTITLPAPVTMITGTGLAANQQILVNNFTSTPAAGVNGMLSVGGTQVLRVGATRSALLSNQVAGSYTTSFTVNVIY